jgi:hypothetical protein
MQPLPVACLRGWLMLELLFDLIEDTLSLKLSERAHIIDGFRRQNNLKHTEVDNIRIRSYTD